MWVAGGVVSQVSMKGRRDEKGKRASGTHSSRFRGRKRSSSVTGGDNVVSGARPL